MSDFQSWVKPVTGLWDKIRALPPIPTLPGTIIPALPWLDGSEPGAEFVAPENFAPAPARPALPQLQVQSPATQGSAGGQELGLWDKIRALPPIPTLPGTWIPVLPGYTEPQNSHAVTAKPRKLPYGS